MRNYKKREMNEFYKLLSERLRQKGVKKTVVDSVFYCWQKIELISDV